MQDHNLHMQNDKSIIINIPIQICSVLAPLPKKITFLIQVGQNLKPW